MRSAVQKLLVVGAPGIMQESPCVPGRVKQPMLVVFDQPQLVVEDQPKLAVDDQSLLAIEA
jgi:hypothetical protein